MGWTDRGSGKIYASLNVICQPYREEWEAIYLLPPLNPFFYDTSQTVCERSVLCVCAHVRQSTHHIFPTLQMAAILLTSVHCSPRNLRPESCTEDRNKHACLFVCLFDKALVSSFFANPPFSIILEEHWLKLFSTTRKDPSVLYMSYHKAQSWRSLAALSSNEKQGGTSNSWQSLGKKGIFYS